MIGDHIRVLKDGRWSHAVDCGDETVIHLVESPPLAGPRIRRVYRPEFVAGAAAVEVVTHRERTFPARQVVSRAYSRIADPAPASTFRDSEQFACWCKVGRTPEPTPRPAPASAAPAAREAKAERPARARRRPPPKARAGKPAARPAAKPRPAGKAGAKAGRKVGVKPAPGAKGRARAAGRRPGTAAARRPARRSRPKRR
jgi:hypothetical protein